MVKKALGYCRKNFWVLILWLVAVMLCVAGAIGLEKVPDIVFVGIFVIITVALVIDFVRFEKKTRKSEHVKVVYKRKCFDDILSKIYDALMKNPETRTLLTKKWTDNLGTSLQYFLEYHECERITDHELVACSIFAFTGARDDAETYEALYFAFRDMISAPMTYDVVLRDFYDEMEFVEVNQMPTKNLALLEVKKGDSIVEEIAKIAANPKTMDKLDELVTYLREMYDAAKNTTEY